MSFKLYREESRANWGIDQGHNLNIDQIKLGALLRIADAVETMAKSYDGMRIDRDWWKGRSELKDAEIHRLKSVLRGLRGALTKARNK